MIAPFQIPTRRPQVPVPEPEKQVFESKPRWPNAPKICIAENLPAYSDEREFKKQQEKYFPGFTATKSWLCNHCGHWHFTGIFVVGSNGEHLAKCDKALLTKPSNWERVKHLIGKRNPDHQKKLL